MTNDDFKKILDEALKPVNQKLDSLSGAVVNIESKLESHSAALVNIESKLDAYVICIK